jgi:galactokinase
MSKFDDFVEAIEEGVKQLAKNTLRGFKEEALSDAKDFLEASRDDIKRWTKLLADGKLTQEDFEWLVMSRRDVAELHVLKQKGLSKIRIDRFKTALLDLVIDTAFDIF